MSIRADIRKIVRRTKRNLCPVSVCLSQSVWVALDREVYPDPDFGLVPGDSSLFGITLTNVPDRGLLTGLIIVMGELDRIFAVGVLHEGAVVSCPCPPKHTQDNWLQSAQDLRAKLQEEFHLSQPTVWDKILSDTVI